MKAKHPFWKQTLTAAAVAAALLTSGCDEGGDGNPANPQSSTSADTHETVAITQDNYVAFASGMWMSASGLGAVGGLAAAFTPPLFIFSDGSSTTTEPCETGGSTTTTLHQAAPKTLSVNDQYITVYDQCKDESIGFELTETFESNPITYVLTETGRSQTTIKAYEGDYASDHYRVVVEIDKDLTTHDSRDQSITTTKGVYTVALS